MNKTTKNEKASASAFTSNNPPVGTSLNDRLAAYRAQSEALRPEVARAYDRLVERLATIDRNEVGPDVGQRMPDFVMPDQTGALVSLTSLLERGPLIVSFNRGHWCPYCKLDLRALAAAYHDIVRVGAHVVSIMPDTAEPIKKGLGPEALPFPILSDIDLGYTLSLGLIYWVGPDMIRIYRELGIDLERYQTNDHFFLPLAAKFLIGRDGLVKARHVDLEFRQRIEPIELIARAGL